MAESAITEHILNRYGHLPIVTRKPGGIIFRESGNHVAVMRNHPIHAYQSGTYYPIDTNWKVGASGELGTEFLAPRILDDGEVQFLGSRFRFKPTAVGTVTLDPLSFNVIRQLPTGYVSGNQYIIEVGIYRYILTLHEGNKIKVELELPEMPPGLSGDYFVVASEILDTAFPSNKILQKYELYDGEKIRFDGGIAQDANFEMVPVQSIIREVGGKKYFLTGVPISWLENATYPVVIDPTTTFQPADASGGFDAWTNQDAPTVNENDADLWTGAQSGVRASYLRFTELSSINDYAAMISSTLTLYLSYSNNLSSAMTVYLTPLRRNWAETTVCWSYYSGTNSWTQSPGLNTTSDRYNETITRVFGPGVEATGDKTWNAATPVDAWLGQGRTNYGWLLYRTSIGDSTSGLRFGSSGSSTAGNRPELEVVYAPRVMGSIPMFFG